MMNLIKCLFKLFRRHKGESKREEFEKQCKAFAEKTIKMDTHQDYDSEDLVS